MGLLEKLFTPIGQDSTPTNSPKNDQPKAVLKEIPSDLLLSIHTMKDDLAALDGKQAVSENNIISTKEVPKPANPFLSNDGDRDQTPQEPAENQEQTTKKPSLSELTQAFMGITSKSSGPENPLRPEDFSYEERKSLEDDASHLRIPSTKNAMGDEITHLKGLPSSHATDYPEVSLHVKKSHPVLTSLLVLLFLGLVSGGIFFWKDYRPTVVQLIPDSILPDLTKDPSPESKNTPIQEPAQEETFPEKITIDSEKSTPVEIRSSLLEVGKNLIESNSAQPKELTVVDAAGVPVSFGTFSRRMNISLSPELISALQDKFSLFLYNDTSAIRVGLILYPNDSEHTRKLILSAEPQLIRQLTPIFLEVAPATRFKDAIFAESAYNDAIIRYANVPTPTAPFIGGLSIDYTIYDEKLILGTSKQTERAIIDRLKK